MYIQQIHIEIVTGYTHPNPSVYHIKKTGIWRCRKFYTASDLHTTINNEELTSDKWIWSTHDSCNLTCGHRCGAQYTSLTGPEYEEHNRRVSEPWIWLDKGPLIKKAISPKGKSSKFPNSHLFAYPVRSRLSKTSFKVRYLPSRKMTTCLHKYPKISQRTSWTILLTYTLQISPLWKLTSCGISMWR